MAAAAVGPALQGLYLWDHPLQALAVVALLVVRTVRGPLGLPFLGNLPGLMAGDATEYLDRCVARYGSVLKVWAGTRPWVVVADPHLVRKLAYRNLARPAAMHEYGGVVVGPNFEVDQASAFVAAGEVWRRGRRAFEASVIQPASLSAHLPAINRCADRFVERLAARAAPHGPAAAAAATAATAAKGAAAGNGSSVGAGSREAASPPPALNILAELGNCTLAVVGEIAYGIDFGTYDDDDDGGGDGYPRAVPERGGGQAPEGDIAAGKAPAADRQHPPSGVANVGRSLAAACTSVFRHLQMDQATRYLPLQASSGAGGGGWLIFPSFKPAIRWLALHFPDPPQTRSMRARSDVAAASRQLMEAWLLESKAAAAEAVEAAVGHGAKGGPAAVNVCKAAAVAGHHGGKAGLSPPIAPQPHFRAVGGGICSSSFMAAMMEGRRGAAREERMSDVEVIAQGFTFMLAGFETTANTLAAAAFLLATHPQAAERLAAEAAGVAGRELSHELLAELPYTSAVLQETLRLYPPLPFLTREAREEVDLGGGKTAPQGSFLVLLEHAMHTSASHFPHPQRFMPERWLPESGGALGPADPHAYAPFGVGARMCVGYKLANLVAKAALVRVFGRFRVSLHPRQHLPLAMRTGLSRAPTDGVWVSLQERERDGNDRDGAATAAAPGAAEVAAAEAARGA
ncbi:hypothetical protein GPECTOR_45g173 [Gonium pectorale]|uniref:Cytochrome P450 n=1 Tax=Gonium pectorale TaxID=33097 RepID=A0A150G963_GONPE|nr:hypothetical protein GPECTOR_45g173 [Gonium pectorale]|eukprot:KXZ46303.1 hypothetical protein GPECTOR_45g173 [Gonium pectorale]